jgi:hypothetical protein
MASHCHGHAPGKRPNNKAITLTLKLRSGPAKPQVWLGCGDSFAFELGGWTAVWK